MRSSRNSNAPPTLHWPLTILSTVYRVIRESLSIASTWRETEHASWLESERANGQILAWCQPSVILAVKVLNYIGKSVNAVPMGIHEIWAGLQLDWFLDEPATWGSRSVFWKGAEFNNPEWLSAHVEKWSNPRRGSLPINANKYFRVDYRQARAQEKATKSTTCEEAIESVEAAVESAATKPDGVVVKTESDGQAALSSLTTKDDAAEKDHVGGNSVVETWPTPILVVEASQLSKTPDNLAAGESPPAIDALRQDLIAVMRFAVQDIQVKDKLDNDKREDLKVINANLLRIDKALAAIDDRFDRAEENSIEIQKAFKDLVERVSDLEKRKVVHLDVPDVSESVEDNDHAAALKKANSEIEALKQDLAAARMAMGEAKRVPAYPQHMTPAYHPPAFSLHAPVFRLADAYALGTAAHGGSDSAIQRLHGIPPTCAGTHAVARAAFDIPSGPAPAPF